MLRNLIKLKSRTLWKYFCSPCSFSIKFIYQLTQQFVDWNQTVDSTGKYQLVNGMISESEKIASQKCYLQNYPRWFCFKLEFITAQFAAMKAPQAIEKLKWNFFYRSAIKMSFSFFKFKCTFCDFSSFFIYCIVILINLNHWKYII